MPAASLTLELSVTEAVSSASSSTSDNIQIIGTAKFLSTLDRNMKLHCIQGNCCSQYLTKIFPTDFVRKLVEN